jgi:hypothetical protein
LLAFQRHVHGGVNAKGWRLLHVAKISDGCALQQNFAGSRGAVHKKHYEWKKLFARVA